MPKDKPNEIDIYAGQRVKQARDEAGMSQNQLADKCGISFQQIQKYQSGKNRMSVSRLAQIAEILDQPVSYFFEAGRNDLVRVALKLERVIKRHRERDDQILAIISRVV
ncbi:MAG: helix-turn-helix domain-containing protein [Candidatus Anammoxibacter sp.]